MAQSWLPTLFGGGSLMRPPTGGDPFLQMQQEMNRLFDETVRGFGLPAMRGGRAIATPRLNVSETDDAIRIEAELPGVAADDIEVELVDDVLTISGEKKTEQETKDERYHVMERSYGSFARSITLPFAVKPDQVQASFENGVLTITVPKSAARETVHRIAVEGGGARTSGGKVESLERAAAGDKPNVAGEQEKAPAEGQPQSAAGQPSGPAAG